MAIKQSSWRGVAVAVMALALASCTSQATPLTPAAPSEGPPPPALTFLDLQDASHSFDEYKGKTVLLVMFAYWCPHCQDDMPKIQQYVDAHPTLTLVPIEASGGPKNLVIDFKTRYGLTATTFYDPAMRAATALAIKAYPTSIFLSKDGGVADRTEGSPPFAKYDSLLAGSSRTP
jgi:cytochrome c biogenesis protein CcmG/thiol:disulfide interchange protein DsbE